MKALKLISSLFLIFGFITGCNAPEPETNSAPDPFDEPLTYSTLKIQFPENDAPDADSVFCFTELFDPLRKNGKKHY